ncbi:hypothetical protein GOHSU_22_00680 [Gordonia hirsuta DSM 44140 = NBRC 16056]|uniref:Translation initiation factor n=1 Tax=Gordonia hirsuta DSM 44140 = NBRC 16056 TaxID=1121927 RepID=L7LC47_9ACTN|nr:DUF6319 family protein [Gordonia hirsuta]GAC57608.1 hypothetical protein GOHSU_22_00680 [Gordonia hirsuta DSM 44140 = NBRC 16056]
MPPRRRTSPAESLTGDDLTVLAAAVAEGRRATVYLREGTPSLGLPPGSSARVIAVDGDTVVVRPRGIDDELPYEADELRRTKNPPPAPEAAVRKTPAKKMPAKKTAVKKTAAKKTAATAAATTPAATATTSSATTSSVPPQKTAPKATARTAAKPAPRGAGKSVTVTLYGSPDNQWSVAVTRGARKPQRSRPVSPESVDAAVAELGDVQTVEAVTSLLQAARAQAQARVAELSRELDAAKAALAALQQPD